MTRANDFATILAALLQVPDPDPDREVVACPDCRTPALVLTPSATGPLLAVQHDTECPTYNAMTEDERTVIDDEGSIVHTSRQEQQDWQERRSAVERHRLAVITAREDGALVTECSDRQGRAGGSP